MTLVASTYFEHFKAYVNSDYVMHDGASGKVVLTEKCYRPENVKPQQLRLELLLLGAGMAFKLDHYDFDTAKKKSKPAPFRFLDDTAKPWSKLCDFVMFYVNGRTFHGDCIEFKSKFLTADKIVPMLNSGMSWVKALKRTIEHYIRYIRRIRMRKFAFAEKDRPDHCIARNRKLLVDCSVRYYHFDEGQDRSVADLQNASVQDI